MLVIVKWRCYFCVCDYLYKNSDEKGMVSMFKNVRLSAKLLSMIVIISVIPLILLSYVSYHFSKAAVQEEVYQQNFLFFELARFQINSYFGERKGDVRVLANEIGLILSEEEISESTETVIVTGELGGEKRKKLDKILKDAIEEYNYSDTFITNERGKVIYDTMNRDREGKDRAD